MDHSRAYHDQCHTDRRERDEDRHNVHEGREDKANGAQYFGMPMSRIAVGLKSAAQPWPDVTSLSLGTTNFIEPLPTNATAKTMATIHSAVLIRPFLADGH